MNALILCLSSTFLGQSGPEAISLETRNGKVDFVLDAARSGDRHVLVLGSLAAWNQPCQVHVMAEPTTQSTRLAHAAPSPNLSERHRELARRKERLGKARRHLPPIDEFAPPSRPSEKRVFHLFAGERDLERRDQYVAVDARLHSFNACCQVYVEVSEKDSADRDAAIRDILTCFEREVRPWADNHVGKTDDVDRDGRFTIFLSGRLSRMEGGKTSLDGFVRGSDFFLDVPEPFSNRCDMLVLNSNLKAGPHLRTVLLHEYVHAVAFCGHALRKYPEGPRHEEEESWLNESLSHLAEDLCGLGRSNLEHRVKAYLDATHEHPLVIPDAFSAGLWRSPGVRGAGFLFLRYAYQQGQPDLVRQLAQSNLKGIENLETAAGRTFEELFRGFTIDLARRSCLSDSPVATEAWPGRPRAVRLKVDGGEKEIRLTGTGCCVLQLEVDPVARTRFSVRFPPSVPMQATLLRMPEN